MKVRIKANIDLDWFLHFNLQFRLFFWLLFSSQSQYNLMVVVVCTRVPQPQHMVSHLISLEHSMLLHLDLQISFLTGFLPILKDLGTHMDQSHQYQGILGLGILTPIITMSIQSKIVQFMMWL